MIEAAPRTSGTGAYTNLKPYVPGAVESEDTGTNPGRRAQSFQPFANNVLSDDQNRLAGSSHSHKPRGSWKIDAIWALETGGTTPRDPLPTDNTVYVQFTVTEPLLHSPCTFGNREKNMVSTASATSLSISIC